MKYPSFTLFAILFLTIWSPIQSQIRTVIHDGITGMEHCHIIDDTVFVLHVVKKSPAWEAGIRRWDKVISINDSLVSKKGLTLRDVNDLLFDKSGEPVQLQIIKDGTDSVIQISLIRESTDSPRQWLDYAFLTDSTKTLTFDDILTDSINRMFTHVLDAKLSILSVEEGSMAAEAGLKTGDKIYSLTEALDNHDYLSLDFDFMGYVTEDTSIEVLRNGIEVRLELDPRDEDALLGVTTKFGTDFMQNCVWIKFKMSNKISSDKTYVLNCHSATDTLIFYEESFSSEHIVRKAGVLLPPEERDFVYKNWEAIKIHVKQGEELTFYLRFSGDGPVYIPWFRMVPLDTVTRFDRLERMIVAGFAGMAILICFYYLILFISNRRKQFLFYPIFIITFLFMLMYEWGYSSEIIWGETYIILVDLFDLIYALPFCFFLLFGIYYLDMRANLRLWYRIAIIDLWILVISQIILNGYYLVAENDAYNVFTGIFLFITAISSFIIPPLLLLIATIIRLIKGFKPAWYFLSALLVLGLLLLFQETRPEEFGSAETHVSNFSVVIGNSAVLLGAILQFLIFSLGLAQKMKMDETEKKLAQERIIESLKENEKLKDKVNRELEGKVRERTREISEQKEEIESQRDEIEAQRDQLQGQKDVVVAQKQKLTDSINYAQRIQTAILPHKEYMDEIMPEYFVLFKPRDIVSGDFYWIKEVRNTLIIVAADCTGHGVPGAFMSMLGITLLNEQIGKSRFDSPGEIMNRLRKKVKHTLAQEGKDREQKDGMDMALATIDKDNMELQFAGAFNPLYIIRHKNVGAGDQLEQYASTDSDDYRLFEIKGDKQPIGTYWEETAFTTHSLKLHKRDTIYLFSDGYVDQYGGENRKKFLSKNFKRYLLEIQGPSMKEQHQLLNSTLEKWRTGNEQVDDILVMGIRV